MALPLAQVAYKIYKSHKLMQGEEDTEEDEDVPSDAEEELSGGEEPEEEEEDDDEWVPKERRSRIEEEEQWTLQDFSWYIQFVFVFIALGNAVRFGMEALRYRTVKDYYVNGELADPKNTNWWKTGNGVFLQGGFWIWSVATITQMLSLFDMA